MIEVTKPRAIALGYFDGVHLGHRALMQRAVERAKQIGGTSAVFTFDVHPDSVVMGRQVPLLTANAYRTEEIKKLGGVDEVIFGHFDHEMQHMDWRDFIHKLLIGRFNAGWIISGRNNRFGYKGQGNAEGMAIECEKAGIGYDCIEDVKIDGIVVSSTYIRQLISQGDMEGAAKFLGHPYTVSGIVEHGRRVGTCEPSYQSYPQESSGGTSGGWTCREIQGIPGRAVRWRAAESCPCQGDCKPSGHPSCRRAHW